MAKNLHEITLEPEYFFSSSHAKTKISYTNYILWKKTKK